MSLREPLAARGIDLPLPPPPGGAYDPVRVLGGVAYVAIQFPVHNGERIWRGRLGLELSTEDGYQAARLCALNVLAREPLAYPGQSRLRRQGHLEHRGMGHQADEPDDHNPRDADGLPTRHQAYARLLPTA